MHDEKMTNKEARTANKVLPKAERHPTNIDRLTKNDIQPTLCKIIRAANQLTSRP